MAITISFITEGEKLIPTSKPVIASGDRDTVTISVAFDSSWDGYAKSGVFLKKCDKDHNVYEAIMDSNNSCIIPHEALDEAGTTYIGIRGVNGASVYTSSLVAYRIDPGAPEGTTATVPPTASVYQQLLTANAVLSSRVDEIASLPEGGTSGDAELRDIRVKADGSTASTAGDAVREQVSSLSESITNIQGDIYDDYFSGIALVNGRYITKGTVLNNLDASANTANTNALLKLSELNHSITVNADYKIAIVPFGFDRKVTHTPATWIEKTSVTKDDIKANAVVETFDIFTIQIRRRDNADMDFSTVNIESVLRAYKDTAIDLSSIEYGKISKKMNRIEWISGRYISTGAQIGNPSAHTLTLSTAAAFPYKENVTYILKEGYKVAFPAFTGGVLSKSSLAFLTDPGVITMDDIKANVEAIGDSYAIMIRKNPEENIVNGINFDDALVEVDNILIDEDNLSNDLKEKLSTKYGKSTWCAIGDSITDGRYSYWDGSTAKTGTDHEGQYNYIASQILGMNPVIEYGYGGMGYVHVANDGTYLTDVLAMDFGNPDVITINLGINDRSVTLGDENSTALDGTISGAIRNCCEVLGQKYPNAQIIFMTPINANDKGTFDTGWSKRGGGVTTLDALCDIIKYWCNKYGYTVIDMTHNCPINDYNIVPLFPDRLHPSKEAHIMIGKYLAGVLPHRN